MGRYANDAKCGCLRSTWSKEREEKEGWGWQPLVRYGIEIPPQFCIWCGEKLCEGGKTIRRCDVVEEHEL